MEVNTSIKWVLSTKLLLPAQKKFLLDTGGVRVYDYDAIKIEFLDFEAPIKIKNAIFTSKNAVNALKNSKNSALLGAIENCYCVGESTITLLQENGQKVAKKTNYASELANFIVKNKKSEVFYFFCGNLRKDEIPSSLKNAKIEFFEVKTYKTDLNLMNFEQKWDYILFFSPSAVQSFTAENSIQEAVAICIGNTTASEAKLHTKNVITSQKTTIDSVIMEAVSQIKDKRN